MNVLSFAKSASYAMVIAGLSAVSSVSHAAIFEDGEARRAILELRQRVDSSQQAQQRTADELRRATEENSQIRRGLLDLQTQIETLRAESASLRGQNEQLARDVAELQRKQKDISLGVEERFRQFEPVKVSLDGVEFQAESAEKRDFEAALVILRAGKFADASTAFMAFARQYPRSGYLGSARFWLGNAQYASRDYKEAIQNFKLLLTDNPSHARAPEAALSIANCQMELKDTRAARKTLEELQRAYPQSEAAAAAKERLSRLK